MKKMERMKRFIFILLTIVALVCTISSCGDELEYDSDGKISGTVIDMISGEPIQNALITLSPSGLNTYTGYDGDFEFLGLSAKQYTLTAQKEGYSANRKTVTIKAGEYVNVSLVMEKSE